MKPIFSFLMLLPSLAGLAQSYNYVANTASGSSAGLFNTLVGVQAGVNIVYGGQGNLFLGYQAGYATTSGNSNVYLGLGAAYNNTTGTSNVALGYQAAVGTGSNNVSIGFQAGINTGGITDAVNIGYLAGHSSNVSGNVFIGSKSGTINSSGSENTFLGYYSGSANTSGGKNTFLGYQAGQSNTSGLYNTFVGDQAGYSTSQGLANTFVGAYAGNHNTSDYGTFLGVSAGLSNTTGAYNTLLGYAAGRSNTTGVSNTFMGSQVGSSNTTGSNNTFIGVNVGYANTTGGNNTFMGYQAGYFNSTGSNNIIIGPNSGTAITTSDENVLMGYNSQAEDGLQNAIAIGANSHVAVSNALILGNQVNVGIGTSAPKSKLEIVADEVDASGLRLSKLTSLSKPTQATDQFLTVNEKGDVVKARYQLRINNPNEWSDKVFSPSYQLRSLPSVATFISQHGHLPGVPSAEQVVKEGVDLVKMNATLLEKVEELTLYSVQQDEKAIRQEAINQQQQKQIDELKALVKQLLEKK